MTAVLKFKPAKWIINLAVRISSEPNKRQKSAGVRRSDTIYLVNINRNDWSFGTTYYALDSVNSNDTTLISSRALPPSFFVSEMFGSGKSTLNESLLSVFLSLRLFEQSNCHYHKFVLMQLTLKLFH